MGKTGAGASQSSQAAMTRPTALGLDVHDEGISRARGLSPGLGDRRLFPVPPPGLALRLFTDLCFLQGPQSHRISAAHMTSLKLNRLLNYPFSSSGHLGGLGRQHLKSERTRLSPEQGP